MKNSDCNALSILRSSPAITEKGTPCPLRMKKNIDPPEKDMDAFDLLDKIPGVRRGPGGVICLYDRLVSLKGSDRVIPINYL
jgi:putative GTP-binding protein